MKKLLPICLLLSFCLYYNFSKAATSVAAGTLSSAHWTLAGSPYNIMGHIIVANNDSLVIDPGVVVEFQGKYKLFCNGKIIANGTPSLPILFTVPVANRAIGWLGIRYDNTPITNGQSSFKYCTIEYGRANVTGDNAGGGLYFNNFGNCIIDNSVIRYCYGTVGGAIYANKSSPTITNDSFYNNTSYSSGECLEFWYSSSHIDSCYLKGAGITCYYSSLNINNNQFYKCNAAVASYSETNIGYLEITNNNFDSCYQKGGGGGGAVLLLNAQAKIEHNIFKRNTSTCAGGAISCFTQVVYPNSNKIIISNNLFYGNKSGINYGSLAPYGGGAISFSNCSGKVINNTIVNNYSDTAGGAIICFDGSSPSFYNNIIFDNSTKAGIENVFVLDNLSDPNFYHNDIQGGYLGINTNGTPLVSANVNNIDSIPRFTNPVAGIYTLDSISACIDSGTTIAISTLIPSVDLAGNPRIAGGFIDMGAYESKGKPSFILSQKHTNYISIFPNPANNYIEFEGLQANQIKSIRVFDILGKEIAYYEQVLSNRLDISSFQNGLLILKIQSKNDQLNIVKVLKQ